MVTPEQKQEILSQFEKGVSSSEIAESMEISPQVIWGIRSHWSRNKYSNCQESLMTPESVQIITDLANGKNPESGESLPTNHFLQSPSVIRALFHALRAMGKIPAPKKKQKERRRLTEDELNEKQAENIKNGRPKNSHFPWSAEQQKNLAQSYLAGKLVKELAKSFGRSKQGIAAQLGKIAGIQFEMLDGMSKEVKQKRLKV
jgi:predicted DNA-binding protein YlxM (UPF0122 family)